MIENPKSLISVKLEEGVQCVLVLDSFGVKGLHEEEADEAGPALVPHQ